METENPPLKAYPWIYRQHNPLFFFSKDGVFLRFSASHLSPSAENRQKSLRAVTNNILVKALFHSAVEAAQKSWFFYEPIALLSTYKTYQKRFMEAYSPYEKLVERYRNVAKREIYLVTEEYLEENKVAEENIALLKNAIELWRSASQSTDAIAPILFHYSWHCFNSFFAYTFFRWEPQHGTSHGIELRLPCTETEQRSSKKTEISEEKLNKDTMKLRLRFRKEDAKEGQTKGLFQRLVDTWTLLGCSPAFSAFLPVLEAGQIQFHPNQLFLLEESKSLELEKLLVFDPVKDYECKYWNTFGREKLIQNTSFSNSMNLPTCILQSYLLLFAASSVARYRPILWSSILSGGVVDEAAFALAYRKALLAYAQFGINSHSFLDQLESFLSNVSLGKFELRKLP